MLMNSTPTPEPHMKTTLPSRLAVTVLSAITALAALAAAGCQSTPTTAPRGEAALSPAPPGVETYVTGALALRDGDKSAALTELTAAVQVNPDLRMAHELLADVYLKDGRLDLAEQQYQAATRLDPYYINNWYNLGLVEQMLHKFQDAVDAYLGALNIEPNDARCNMNLGVVYIALGRLSDAVACLTLATHSAPQDADAWSNLGVALDAQGQTHHAEAAYREALELNPTTTTAMQNLASNLIGQGKANEALAVLEKLVQVNDSAFARKRYGDALVLTHRDDEAILQYNISLSRDPRYYGAMTEKAFALIDQYRQGLQLDESKRKEAIALWQQSLRLHPNQPRAAAALRQWQNMSLGASR
jgi:tetratricopeptide (TPR) repeat protein